MEVIANSEKLIECVSQDIESQANTKQSRKISNISVKTRLDKIVKNQKSIILLLIFLLLIFQLLYDILKKEQK